MENNAANAFSSSLEQAVPLENHGGQKGLGQLL